MVRIRILLAALAVLLAPATEIDFGAAAAPTYTCYLDADGDGYGPTPAVSESGVETCSTDYYLSGELTSTTGDCDDSNANVNPGETEVCGNGIDEDCNGVDASCPPGGATEPPRFVGSLRGEVR